MQLARTSKLITSLRRHASCLDGLIPSPRLRRNRLSPVTGIRASRENRLLPSILYPAISFKGRCLPCWCGLGTHCALIISGALYLLHSLFNLSRILIHPIAPAMGLKNLTQTLPAHGPPGSIFALHQPLSQPSHSIALSLHIEDVPEN